MKLMIFPWQSSSWASLQQMRSRLPHAILIHGLQGVGKTQFAEYVAQSLLCEMPDAEGHACGACASCGWYLQYGHPVYRRVRQEILDENEPVESEEGADAASDITPAMFGMASSKEIKIDLFWALASFMNISTHRQGRRVLLLYPAEARN